MTAGTLPVAVARPRTGVPPALTAWIALLIVIVAAGLAAFAYQFANGLVVTGLRNTMMWGNYILFFMFFVGLSAGGLIVASAGRLFGVSAFKPITRLAVVEATIAVMLAGIFIIPDLGRPERVLNILLYANLSSPMVWDITIVVAYTVLSMSYVWLYTREDLARRRSWLAFGTGVSEREHARDERLKSALAWVALPAAILLHSITAWIFGLQISRTFWYSAIMAPLFIASALVSGLALVILLALALRRLRRIEFDDRLVSYLGALLAVFVVVEAFFVGSEFLTAAYPGVPDDATPIARLLSGAYAPLFWTEFIVGLAIPFVILAVRGMRRRPALVAAASGLAVVGIFVHRLNLLLNGLSYVPIPLPPGVAIGAPQVNTPQSFAAYHWYVPTAVEWLIVAGVLAFGALLFTLAGMYLPLREGPTHASSEAR